MTSIIARLKQFDAYTKPLDDFRVKTFSGGAVTLISTVVIIGLIVAEMYAYLQTETVEELFVDSTSADDRVDIQFDIAFHKLPCPMISVDVMDVSGDHQTDVKDAILKQRLDKNGNGIPDSQIKQEINFNKTVAESNFATDKAKCGSCYGAQTFAKQCCNTCQEVKEAYRHKGWVLDDIEAVEQCTSDVWVQTLIKYKHEGCRVHGKVQVGKVVGNFHIAPGHPMPEHHAHVHNLHSMAPNKFDTSHRINHLSFGHPYPGKKYPLDGKSFPATKGGTMFQYYVKVVPTMYVTLDQTEIFTHQFSVTKHQKAIEPGVDGLPGFFVQYEFSPLMVRFEEKRQSVTHFLVTICAIIGGVFTVASLIDAFIYQSAKVLQQKIDLGKAS